MFTWAGNTHCVRLGPKPQSPPVRTDLNEAGGVYVHMYACALRQRITPGPAASYKALTLLGTIKAPCGQPSFFLPLNLQWSLQNHLTVSSINRPPTGWKQGHAFNVHMHTQSCRMLSHSHIKLQTYKHPQVSEISFFPPSYFSQQKQAAGGRTMSVHVCADTVWGSVEQAYLAQHQHWDDLHTVSVVLVQRESLCPPGRGQAGILSQQPPAPRVKII